MNYNYVIKPFSSYDNWTVSSETENISSVIDKLIRIAAKITESFASDIIYDINALNDAVENALYYDRVLLFQESGIPSLPVKDGVVTYPSSVRGIQVWRLSHDPDRKHTILTRVYLSAELPYGSDIVGM